MKKATTKKHRLPVPNPRIVAPHDTVNLGREVFFGLTAEFNAEEYNAVLASGQATVYHRVVMASKDGDWIVRETPQACHRILDVLTARGARYRPLSAPLDPKWLGGGWSSHLEYTLTPAGPDKMPYLIRCDFISRPTRVPQKEIPRIFERAHRTGAIAVVDLESLIWLKQTRREKDYPIIGEIARRLPPEVEIWYSQDPSRIIELAPRYPTVTRACVQSALRGESKRAIGLAIYAERLDYIEADEKRVRAYLTAGRDYFRALRMADVPSMPLSQAHDEAIKIADALLPIRIPESGG